MRIGIEEQNVTIEVKQIEFRGVNYDVPSQSCHIHVSLVDKAGTGAYSYFIPFRYEGDWEDDYIKLYALNHLEDVDLDKGTDKEFISPKESIPTVLDISTKSWWEYILFWK